MPGIAPLDRSSTQPRYRQVADRIRAYVLRQHLQPGDSLPSERRLATVLGVTHATVRVANSLLENEGVITRRHGAGTFLKASTGQILARRSATAGLTVGYLAVGTDGLRGYPLRQYSLLDEAARAHDAHVVVAALAHDDPSVLPQKFIDDGVFGFIVDGDLSPDYLQRLAHVDQPFVIAGNHPPAPGLTCVRVDYSELYRQVVLRLAEAGHRTIWCQLEPFTLFYTRELFEGYRRGMREAGVVPELLVLDRTATADCLTEQFTACVERFGPRQAIILGFPNVALLRRLEDRGVDTAGIDIVCPTNRAGPALEPWCSELPLPSDAMGRAAADRLFAMLRGREAGSVAFVPRVGREARGSHTTLSATWRMEDA